MKNKRDFTFSKSDRNLWQKLSATITKFNKNALPDEQFFAEEMEKSDKIAGKKGEKGKAQAVKAVGGVVGKPKSNVLGHLALGDDRYVDGATFRRLVRGQIRVVRRIDLHAMNRDSALARLGILIPEYYGQNLRCILVITGKGSGVLRDSMVDFLNYPSVRPYVLCFVQALGRDGGGGAFYVYLKKNNL